MIGVLGKTALLGTVAGIAGGVILGCTARNEVRSDRPPATPTAEVTGTAFGVAGVIPRNWPQSSASDWEAFYASLSETGGLLGLYTDWLSEAGVAGEAPRAIAVHAELGERYGFSVLSVIGFHQDVGEGVRLTIDWGDATQVEAFTQAAVAVANRYQPAYLGIGNEVNRIWEADPAAFEGFAAALPQIAEGVRAASPQTRVFTVFQLETLRGGGTLTGKERDPHFELVERVASALDLIAFTTYPFLDYATPEAIPEDYYRAIAERVGIPIGFTEVGWPSEPLNAAPTSEFGGTEEEQAAFVRRFGDLIAGGDVRFALWSFAYDACVPLPAPFESIALGECDGSAKPALAAWQALASGR